MNLTETIQEYLKLNPPNFFAGINKEVKEVSMNEVAIVKKVDSEILREGRQIILPEKMSFDEAIDTLQRKKQQDEQAVGINEHINAFPLEGAYAFSEVMKRRYGWADAVDTVKQGLFGPTTTPPQTVSLEVGYNTSVQVIWGSFRVPGVDGSFETGTAKKDGKLIFCINGNTRQRFKKEIQDLAQEVRDYVRENSIYKGKALQLKTDEDGDFDWNSQPKFLDLSKVNESELIFPNEVLQQVQTSLFTPVEKTEQCRKYGIPLKRGILLEGPYGTGKTLTAYVTAKKAVDNNWTFIYLDRVSAIHDALAFAKEYAPAVLFAEDIDRIVEGDDRTADIDDVLNTIDGVDAKGCEIITILTTNHVDRINVAMLRPGRLDAVITINPPDQEAVEKLMRLYSRGLIDIKENIKEAAREMDGKIPAVIREVVERSKLAAVSRMNDDEELKLKGSDLLVAAKTMKNHMALMKPKLEEVSVHEKFGQLMGDVVEATLNGTKEKINEIHSRLN